MLIHEAYRSSRRSWIQSLVRQGFSSARYRFIEYFSHIRHCEGCSCAVPWCGDSIRTFLYCIANATASSSSRGIPATDRVILCAYEIELFIGICTRVAKCPLVNLPVLRRSSNYRRVGKRLRSVRHDRVGYIITTILIIPRWSPVNYSRSLSIIIIDSH